MKPEMMRLWAILTALIAIVGCSQPEQPAPASPPEAATYAGTIVAMGDSLTEGLGVSEADAYPALLERKLRADGLNYQVINAGVSGETSSGALSRVEWVLTLEPDIVILETGANDGLRAIDTDLTAGNLDRLLTTFEEAGVIVVLAGMKTLRNLGPDYTPAFEAIYPAMAEQHDVILMPFFLEGVAANPTLNQPDGVHPTDRGYRVIVETLYPYVLQAIEAFETRHRE
jgi:acyl-CoA thioesterase-1